MDVVVKKVSFLRTPDEGMSRCLAEKLKELLALAESGEAIGLLGCVFLRGGKYMNVGTSTYSRHEQAGVLLECAMERIRDD